MFRTIPLFIIRSFSLYILLFIQHNGEFSPENYLTTIRNWHFSACCFLLLPIAAWLLHPNVPFSIQFRSTLYSSLKVTDQVKRHFCEIWLLHCPHPSFHTYEWHHLPLFRLQLNYDSDEILMRSTKLWSPWNKWSTYVRSVMAKIPLSLFPRILNDCVIKYP